MHRLSVAWGLTFIVIAGCSPVTLAPLVPQLHVGLRSTRRREIRAASAEMAEREPWGLTVFAHVAWPARRVASLMPSRLALAPEAWTAPCAALECFSDAPEDGGARTTAGAGDSP